jgi:cytochrome c oxidase assembly protein subunit 11
MKVDCFCFVEQVLEPGEEVKMPVVFYIDPSIDDDNNLKNLNEITLSYTFFKKSNKEVNNKKNNFQTSGFL